MLKLLLFSIICVLNTIGCKQNSNDTLLPDRVQLQKTEEEWPTALTESKHKTLRHKEDELPDTGMFNIHSKAGTYLCKGCNQELFSSDNKIESDCGWPSFERLISEKNIIKQKIKSHGIEKVEILCARCNSYIGYMFEDIETNNTNKRYCVNSIALRFKEK